MTDVSVEEPTEETASPGSPASSMSSAETGGRPARPFSLSLSAATEPPEPPAPLPSVPSPGEPVSSAGEPFLAVVEALPEPSPVSEAPDDTPRPALARAVPATTTGTTSPSSPVSPVSPVSSAVVKGRIKVADEVVEKVAALATLEVTGVAELGGDAAHAVEPMRERAGIARRGPRGVNAHVQDRTAAVDVTIVAEYGHVVMDVANEVKTNVARTISRMLGMRVVEVNVDVEDVRMPGETGPGAPAGPGDDA
ncbi:Asp23/Gls24 family envelope stress response protein [Streptosporangium sp. NPDC023825]|uniref:Asp23/Gls24 family envelope stress response protein n=1 Tax=Streptosporangium sp. NPDC023825 TaxID=3154909 RepID=UPI00341673E9